ncbi:CHAT domain-containing protein [Acaryochloris sp. IP29b_bin.148]|uniref:CHAT domain-containing protein n=1 Tax=Acaryochloris sp. IP29b_bin.148 TaxID=2969218 RepID=UPI002636BA52|nr:CHAT domain-containing protein [Acaryochloris sp. IP29b_bin.148]
MAKRHTGFLNTLRLGLKRLSVRWPLGPFLLILVSAAFCTVLIPAIIPPATAKPVLIQSVASTNSLVQQGRQLYQAGNYANAITILQQALNSPDAQDNLNQAIIWSNLSLSHQQLGQWQEAKDAVNQSLTTLASRPALSVAGTNYQRILAQALSVQGRIFFAQGQSQAALESWQQTAEIYSQLNDPTGRIRSHIHQSEAFLDLGKSRQALKILQQVEPEMTPDISPVLQASWLHSLGNIHRAMGDLDISQDVLQQSWAMAKTANADSLLGEIHLAMGDTARAQQEWETALAYYQQAENSPASLTQMQARIQQFSLLLAMGKPSSAQSLLSPIQTQISTLPPNKTRLYAQLVLAQHLIDTDLVSAPTLAQRLTQSLSEARNFQDLRAESSALGLLGQLYETTEQPSESLKLTQQAISLAQQIAAPDLAYRWQWQLGRLRYHQGDRSGAISAYTEATNQLQTLRKDLVAINTDASFSFREEVEPVYRELVDLLLQDPAEDAANQANLQKARLTIESLQLAELDNYFREACLDPLQDVDTIEDTAAVVYPIILKDRLEVVLSLPNLNPTGPQSEQPQRTFRHYATAISPKELEQTVEQLQNKLVLPYVSEQKEIQPLAQDLYRWLIQPAEPALIDHDIHTLVFVPDGPFRRIPMATLHDGQQYLVEKYNIAITPGLRLFETEAQDNKRLKSLIAGVTQSVSIPDKKLNFPELPNVKTEIKQIQAKVPSQVLLDQQFTSTNLDQKVQQSPVPVVHIATHGQFSSKAEDTFIVAWGKLINVNEIDDLLRTRDLSSPQALDLLVLSACETAEGDQRAALGIAGVAVRAGARSTLASLWLVDDESTPQLMGEFYDGLLAGASKAEALSLAQRQFIHSKRYHHPRYWASFILLGNWL